MPTAHGRSAAARPPRRVAWRAAWLAAAVILAHVPAHELAAQYACRLKVPHRQVPTTYQPRGTHCEGMYVAEQSSPLDAQVVSLVKGGLRYDLRRDSLLHVHAPRLPKKENAGAVLLQGRARETNLNWALDGQLETGGRFTWDLTRVVRPESLASNLIGLFAESRTTALGDPLYVAVAVTRAPGEADAPDDSLELIVRLPGAAAARWTFAAHDACAPRPGEGCRTATRLNADGFFRIAIPPGPAGRIALAIHWRPRGSVAFADVPQYLWIYRW